MMSRHTYTLRHRLCNREEETTEHVLVHRQKYDAVKKTMIQKLGDVNVKLDLVDLFRTNWRSESYQAIVCF